MKILSNVIKKTQFILLLLIFQINTASYLIFIEGNIGVGKSTFLRLVQNYLPVTVTYEPCDMWQNVGGHNLLDAFYHNPYRWGAAFQMYVFLSRIQKQQEEESIAISEFQIMERSWFSDKYCFAQNAFNAGLLSDLEWSIYLDMWKWQAAKLKKPIAFIYLRAEPEVCYQRLQKRARHEEDVVDIEYIKSLHKRHDDLLLNNHFEEELMNEIPVLTVDCSEDFEHDEIKQQKIVQQILDFLKKHESIDIIV